MTEFSSFDRQRLRLLERNADGVRNDLARRVIEQIKALPENCLQAGDDPPLRTVWDEFKIQVQTEESPLFALYVEEITRHCLDAVSDLPKELQALLWLTGEGAPGRLEEDFKDQVPFGPCLEDELAQELYSRIWSISADEEVVGAPWHTSQLGELS